MLAEGLATGSTLHAATGEAVAICFNCGNLEPVARALRDKFPRGCAWWFAQTTTNTPRATRG